MITFGVWELGALGAMYPYQVTPLLIQVRPPITHPVPRLTSLASEPPIRYTCATVCGDRLGGFLVPPAHSRVEEHDPQLVSREP
jgi:hypothetical protein